MRNVNILVLRHLKVRQFSHVIACLLILNSENSCVFKEGSILKRYFDHITEFNTILSAFISQNSARAQLLQNND